MHASRRTLNVLGATVVAAAVWVAAAMPAFAAAPGTTLLVNRPAGFGGANPGFVNHSSIWGDPGDPGEQSLRVVSDDDNNRFVAFVSDSDGLSADDDDRVSNIYVRDRIAGTTILVSRATGATGAGANGNSDTPAISANGRFVAFRSSASNLSDADENGTSQVYVRDLVAHTTTLVSRADGVAGTIAAGPANQPAVAVSGSTPIVAFVSAAPNLPYANGQSQVYLRSGDDTLLVSTVNGASTTPGAQNSSQPSLDLDGSMVAFTSEAQLVPGVTGDDNSHEDVYRRTVASAVVVLVSRSGGGAGPAGNDRSQSPSIDDTGAHIAFTSSATGLVGGDGNQEQDVFVRTVSPAAMEMASRADGPLGDPGDNRSSGPTITGDGNRVAFVSNATNLAATDTDALPDIFIRNLASDATAVLSVEAPLSSAQTVGTGASISRDGDRTAWQGRSPPREADDDDDFGQVFTSHTGALPSIGFPSGWVSRPTGTGVFRSGVNTGVLRPAGRTEDTVQAMSADGRYTVFASTADEMSPDDDNRFSNIFRRDNLTGETVLVSRADGPDGAAANGSSPPTGSAGLGVTPPPVPAISADGRVVVFESEASNLIAGDGNGVVDVFARDVAAGTTVRASVGPGGAQIPTGGGDPDVSGDGTRVVFSTIASLDPQDGNLDKADIYVRDLASGTTILASRRDGANAVNGPAPSTSGVISDGGSTVAFQTTNVDFDPAVGDTNGKADVFIRRLAAGQTRAVSVRAGLTQTGADTSFAPAIDATGTRVAFASIAPDLVSAAFDLNGGGRDVFVRDTQAGGTTTLVSRTTGPNGVSGNGGSARPTISGDGTRIAFESSSSDLVPGDVNGTLQDVYLRDTLAATTELVSRTHTGAQVAESAGDPSLSASGDCIGFDTSAADVVPGLTGSDFQRAFVRALRGDCPFGPVAAPPGTPGAPGPPAAGDTTKPRITLLRAVPKRFTAGKRFRAATRKRVGVGTRLRIRVSEPARVTLRVVALQPGRRVGKRCVVKARTGRKCIRSTTRGAVNAGRVATAKRVVFTGRVRGRLLAPGRYRLVATATDTAGNRSAPRSIIVTVAKKPPARAT